ncbi:hypothetical protein [Erythrobacter sp. THAF29]|uniref:hypothetical protein n=1 Tax=Erythrobacter sp. THAF29 TaxID=2587851 RepID=UPI001267F91A|nr:hypothetical protein [Erythrobacter sp. THAF29]QFT77172.1 hypothetical protein FIU90_06425 [Erythrobacter sp. THAF29]
MRKIAILMLVALLGLGAWMFFREDGLLEQVTEARVEQALLDNSVPPEMASCMAPRLVDRLSIGQLRKLERMAPQDGETAIPLSMGEAMARLRRVDDREAVETLVRAGGTCGFDLMIKRL